MSEPIAGGRWRASFAAALSLVLPGLGQVHARAWRRAMAVLAVSQGLNLAIHALTRLAAPLPWSVAVLFAIMLVAAGVAVWAAADAWRLVRRPALRPRPAWHRSTWFAFLLLLGLNLGLDQVLPLGWQSFSIPSGSMLPTLHVGDILLADVRRPGALPSPGQVVLFDRPADGGATFIKRVIALPGQRIAVRDGVVTVDGRALPQTDAGLETMQDGSIALTARRQSEAQPNGRRYVVLRLPGPHSDMAERTVPPGAVFVMGDNRDNSLDSRFDTFGPVPVDTIIGTAGTLFWPLTDGRSLRRVR